MFSLFQSLSIFVVTSSSCSMIRAILPCRHSVPMREKGSWLVDNRSTKLRQGQEHGTQASTKEPSHTSLSPRADDYQCAGQIQVLKESQHQFDPGDCYLCSPSFPCPPFKNRTINTALNYCGPPWISRHLKPAIQAPVRAKGPLLPIVSTGRTHILMPGFPTQSVPPASQK